MTVLVSAQGPETFIELDHVIHVRCPPYIEVCNEHLHVCDIPEGASDVHFRLSASDLRDLSEWASKTADMMEGKE